MNIVIIGHNEGESVKEMLSSLLLHYPSQKRIWVLDRCTDNTEEYLLSKNEIIVKTDDNITGRRTSTARNLGLKHCDKEADVLFLDGDRVVIDKGERCNDTDITLMLLEEDGRREVEDYSDILYGRLQNGFYSCGILIKRSAIDKIVGFQGELFPTDLEEDWGIEDTYLGDVAYHLGLSVSLNYKSRLRGRFEKANIDTPQILLKRLMKRDGLNVKWD